MSQRTAIIQGIKRGLIIVVVTIAAIAFIQPVKACGFEGLVKVAHALKAKEAGLPYEQAYRHKEMQLTKKALPLNSLVFN